MAALEPGPSGTGPLRPIPPAPSAWTRARAPGEDPGRLPDEPGPIQTWRLAQAPSRFREVVLLGWESELGRRVAHDPRWEVPLCSALAYRANRYVVERRSDEIPALARQALRLATTIEGRTAAVPAVSALAYVSDHPGEDPADWPWY